MQKTLGILVTTASFVAPLHAQVARFDATTDTIAIAGQTVLGTAASLEARVLDRRWWQRLGLLRAGQRT